MLDPMPSAGLSARAPAGAVPMPRSLEGHVIPPDRLAQILPLVADLAATALAVSRDLSFQADAADFVHVLETEGTKP